MTDNKPGFERITFRVAGELTLGSGKSLPKVRYNDFEVHTGTKVFNTGTGEWEYEKDATLEEDSRIRLALNKEWVKQRPDQIPKQRPEQIPKQLDVKFDYWGFLIYKSIQDFNNRNPVRKGEPVNYRKLVYAYRHAQADHNALKTMMREDGNLKAWTKDPEYKRQDSFWYEGKKYYTVDPPLTAIGKWQAERAGKSLLTLKKHMFPMPKSVYVSPTQRTMQTYLCAFKSIGLGAEHAWILHHLREKQTGNCADILIDEYEKGIKRPPPAGPAGEGLYRDWMEEDHKGCKHKCKNGCKKGGKNGCKHECDNDHKVKDRAKGVHKVICEIDNSDCVALVTHSLLIQHILMSLADKGETILKSFMLDEAGSIAYVIEGPKTPKNSQKIRDDLMKEGKLERFTERLSRIKRDYGTALHGTAFPANSKPVPSRPVPSKPVPSKHEPSKHEPSKHVPSKSVAARQKTGTNSGKRVGPQTTDQRNTNEISMGSRSGSTGNR